MPWIAFDPRKDNFVTEARELWQSTHWQTVSVRDDRMVGDYQVVEFLDEPAYYVREARGNYNYTKAGCLSRPLKTLAEAKAVCEMLDAMEV